MFTGIIEEVGEVVRLTSASSSAVLRVRATTVARDVTHGASIAVNGVCLTVVGQHPATGPDAGESAVELEFDVMDETLRRSVIGGLAPGRRVNLERAARLDSRLDGHIVQGHVDGTGTVVERVPGERWELVRFTVPAGLARYVVAQGSIAVDGVSLTVVEIEDRAAGDDAVVTVSLIPETLERTTLGRRSPGDVVNLEVDVVAKYIERMLATSAERMLATSAERLAASSAGQAEPRAEGRS